jgi:DNA-binding XRE family transcriptional regulator
MADPVTAVFARNVQKARRARHWSQAELAAKSGVSRSAVGTVETQANGPSLEVAVKLARALEATVSALAGEVAE